MDTPQPLLDIALAWASRGLPVMPVIPGGKAPLTRNGLHDASVDPTVLRSWWTRWPTANLAIATGRPGVDVLDVDVRGDQDGWTALVQLRKADLLPAGAPIVRTPSGGIHLYFLGTDQRNGSVHDAHLDFRSTGGYVLVPPSRVVTESYAGVYHWERRGRPVATLDWDAITTLLRPPPKIGIAGRPRPAGRGWDVHTLAASVARQREGNRNRFMFWAFCEALRSGYDDLRPIAEAGRKSGLSVREIEATWRQAVRRLAPDPPGKAANHHASRDIAVGTRPVRTP